MKAVLTLQLLITFAYDESIDRHRSVTGHLRRTDEASSDRLTRVYDGRTSGFDFLPAATTKEPSGDRRIGHFGVKTRATPFSVNSCKESQFRP